MTLWRLELLRLLRTRRWLALAGIYTFFGFLGPLTARYLEQLLEGFASDITVQVPPPTPAAGIEQYVGNAQQVGLLVVILVAVAALGFDARPEIGVFLRTRVTSTASLYAPRFVVTATAAVAAWLLGSLAAWYETAVLLGAPPAEGMLAGMLFGAVYLAMVVAVVALTTAMTTSRAGAVVATVGILLSLPVLGLVPGLRPWLPSELVGALTQLVAGAAPSDYLRATLSALLVTAVAMLGAVRLSSRREL